MAKKKTVKKKTSKRNSKQKWSYVPLKGSFMVFAMLGFFISAYLFTDESWRIALMLVFTIMFIASLVSMSKAPMDV